MKTTVKSYENNIGTIILTPNAFEKFFGVKEEEIRLMHTDMVYLTSKEYCWYNYDTGEEYGHVSQLNNFIRMERFKS